MRQKSLKKIKLQLRTIILFILLGSISLGANAYSQTMRITLNMKNASIENVIKALEEKTNYTFLYKHEVIQNKRHVDVEATNKRLNNVLNELLSPLGLSYTIDDNVIIITNAANNPQQKPTTRKIEGIVKDEDNVPLIGVSVKLQGTDTHDITDIIGYYSIQVPSEGQQVLSFSYVGMETKDVIVGNSNKLDVILSPSSIGLNDIVIEAGYGLAQKRSDMVGSAYQIGSDQIKNLPPVRIDNMLEGLVPGLSIEFNSDASESTRPRMNTRIRGEGSLSAGSEPIWIVDGVRIYTGGNTNLVAGLNSTISPLSYIDPNDIESFTVLKDASSVSIYGADGSNGVILVTTKKGRKNKTSFNTGVRYGISKINENTKFKVLDGKQYMTLAKEAYQNRYADTDPNMLYFPFQDSPNNNYSETNTDWYDEFYDIGSSQQVNVSMSGGSGKFNNYMSASYFRNEGTVKGNRQERFSVRAKIDVELSKRLNLSLNTSLSYNINSIFSPGRDYFMFLPIISPRNDDGTYRLSYNYIENYNGTPRLRSTRFFNSLAERDENDNDQYTLSNRTSALLKYDIIKGLALTGQFGIDYLSSREETYSAMSNWSGRNTLDSDKEVGYATRNSSTNLMWNGVLRLNYSRTFDKHILGGLLGTEMQSKENRNISASGNTFANDYIKEVTQAVNRSGSSSKTTNHVASFFGQLSYSYDSRYYLTVNARRDGNSDFGEDVQWAQFGSVGGSWNIHNESFFDSKIINILKLKASYGTSGNSRLGNVQAKGIYKYGVSYNGNPAAVMESIRNRKLSWETAYMTNLGLRIKLLDRIDIEVEAYDKITDNLISNSGISITTGATAIDANIAKMRNQGIEVNIETVNIKTKDFGWTSRINMSHNRNKILDLYVARLGQTNKVWREGQDVNTWSLVRWAGVNPRNGEPLWYDTEGNITNVYSSNYAVPYKRSTPDLEGGIMNTFIYKDFSLDAIMTYNIGGYSFSTFSRNMVSDGLYIMSQNVSVNELDRWQNPGDIAASPKQMWGISSGSVMNSTRFLFNRTHLRLKNISLGYNLPAQYLKRTGFTNGNLSLIVDNIAIWTLYDKKDRNTYGQSMSGYPTEISYSLGLNLTF